MIDFKKLCERIIDPTFNSISKERLLDRMMHMEISAVENQDDLYVDNNEKWTTLWFTLKKTIFEYEHPYNVIGKNQFMNLISPVVESIVGRIQK